MGREPRSERYKKRGMHLYRMGSYLFDRTDVGDVINNVRKKFPHYPVIEGRMGDPTMYEGLRSYEGFHRLEQRYRNFNPPSASDSYQIEGYEPLKGRLRRGRWNVPSYIPVPYDMNLEITLGVAGALAIISPALLLPPEKKEGAVTDNVVIPTWTYVSHLAEAALSQADVRLCDINREGQVNISHVRNIIDENTRAVIFATVGNPLSTAMKPEVFDGILQVVGAKIKEYGHPIVVIADVIYEHFRRDRDAVIDPIQRALRLGLEVPVIEVSSFSKMMAIPGHRVGFFRMLWGPEWGSSSFRDERGDFVKALKDVYGRHLGQVNNPTQKALGELYTAIHNDWPVEEELAPVAAMLAALKELTDMKGKGTTRTFMKDDDVEKIVKKVGLEPAEWFTASEVVKRVRKLAEESFQGYKIKMRKDLFEKIGEKLQEVGMVEAVVREVRGEPRTFYKLKDEVPDVPRDGEGNLNLYRISEDRDWIRIAEKCEVPTEVMKYTEHKLRMRRDVFKRVFYFAQKLEMLRRKGLGVYLNPAYYDKNGRLDPNRFNSFYVLWGFDKLRKYSPSSPSQAAQVAALCVDNELPIIANTPGELFIPLEKRDNNTSYLRNVALQTREEMDKMLEIIRRLARELALSGDQSDVPDPQMELNFYKVERKA